METTRYQRLEAGIVDPEEIRRLVKSGKARGLIKQRASAPRTGETAVPIERSGESTESTADGVESQWWDVTPEQASYWLMNNFNNRPLDDHTVIAYARDMRNGEWVPTHQGIAFNDRNELIDGQHRLHAIIRSGMTIRMMVTFGLASVIEGKEMTTMDAVDRGRPRSVADQLKIQHGFQHGGIIAGVSLTMGGICQSVRTRKLSVGQTLEIYRAFQPGIDWVIEFGEKKIHGLKTRGVRAACAFAITASEKLKDPCYRLMSGQDLADGTPLHQLRTFLLSEEAILLNRGNDRALAELTLHALQLHVAGVTVEKLEPSQAGVFAFRALQEERVAMVAAMFALPE